MGVDVMDEALSEHVAHQILSHPIHMHGASKNVYSRTILDLALLLDKKNFLAQRHWISLMDKLWLGWSKDSSTRQELRKGSSHVTELLLFIFLPFPGLNPPHSGAEELRGHQMTADACQKPRTRLFVLRQGASHGASFEHAAHVGHHESIQREGGEGCGRHEQRRLDQSFMTRLARFYRVPKSNNGRLCTHTVLLVSIGRSSPPPRDATSWLAHPCRPSPRSSTFGSRLCSPTWTLCTRQGSSRCLASPRATHRCQPCTHACVACAVLAVIFRLMAVIITLSIEANRCRRSRMNGATCGTQVSLTQRCFSTYGIRA